MLRTPFPLAASFSALTLSACASFNPTDPYGLTPEELAAEPPEDSIAYAQDDVQDYGDEFAEITRTALDEACPEINETTLTVIESPINMGATISFNIDGPFNALNPTIKDITQSMLQMAQNPERPELIFNFGTTYGDEPNTQFSFLNVMDHYNASRLFSYCDGSNTGNSIAVMLHDNLTIAALGCQLVTTGPLPSDENGMPYWPLEGSLDYVMWEHNTQLTRQFYEAGTNLSESCLDTLLDPTIETFLSPESALKLGIGIDGILGPDGTLIIREQDLERFEETFDNITPPDELAI